MNSSNSAQKMRKSGKKRRRRADIIAAVLLLCIAVVAAAALGKYVNYLRIDMVLVAENTVQASLDCEVAVLRDEILVYAPSDGQFMAMAPDGTKVKAGSLIGYMSAAKKSGLASGGVPVYVEQGGLIYYDLDGWEGVLTTEEPLDHDWQAIFDQLRQEQEELSDVQDQGLDNQGEGRRVARLVDNFAANLVCLAVTGDIGPYVEDNSVKIQFSGPGEPIALWAELSDMETVNGETHYLIASIDTDETFFYDFRYQSAVILGDQVSGIEIPLSALTQNDEGEVGVLVSASKKLVFRPVTVLYSGEETALVAGLDTTDEVASKPQYAKLGQKIY
jgi:putative membrane fusion protein